jgi:3-hydroxyisobutyrate dehydrogenase-like beta-hydroxyacid dehydrogenase
MKVGVIGLGNMGMGAALNLLHKGHDVTGCELQEATRAAFAAEGGKVVVSPDALPTDLEAVVVFVINAAQTEQVLFGEKGCLSRMEKNARACRPSALRNMAPTNRSNRSTAWSVRLAARSTLIATNVACRRWRS